MKRCNDSKTFIPSISVIFILLMSTIMTGCASTPLIKAAQNGQANVVKDLLDKGADVNETASLWGNWTPLMVAVHQGHTNIVKLLIEKGADIEGALALFKKDERKKDYEFLERLANKYQQPRQGASPPVPPTALPLPTESTAPF